MWKKINFLLALKDWCTYHILGQKSYSRKKTFAPFTCAFLNKYFPIWADPLLYIITICYNDNIQQQPALTEHLLCATTVLLRPCNKQGDIITLTLQKGHQGLRVYWKKVAWLVIGRAWTWSQALYCYGSCFSFPHFTVGTYISPCSVANPISPGKCWTCLGLCAGTASYLWAPTGQPTNHTSSDPSPTQNGNGLAWHHLGQRGLRKGYK